MNDPFLPLVTVALPVFNGAPFLIKAVQSLLNQSFTNWLLLVIDDGSTDGAIEEIKKIKDKRIFIISDGKNKGIASRLNEAIELADTKYFARMDADDICHPLRLEKQIAYLNSHPSIDLLSTSFVIIDEKDNLIGINETDSNHNSVCKQLWKSIPMAHPTWMGKTSWFKKNKYAQPAPFRCEDQELLLRTASDSQFMNLNENLLAYRLKSCTKYFILHKTRKAMLKFQLSFFLKKRNYKFAILSTSIFLIRSIKDIYSRNPYKRISDTNKLYLYTIENWLSFYKKNDT